MLILCCLFCVFVSSNAHAAFTYDPGLNWQTLHTEHFNIHFHNNEEALARKTGGIAEKVHTRISTYLDWKPLTPTDIVLTDRNDFSNASATPFPNNQMNIIITPPDTLNSVEDFNDWLEILLTHEYTHIIHLDKARGAPNILRKIFGRIIPWFFPNTLQPLWEIEGLATHLETNDKAGIGRGQSSYFKMLMRTEFDNGFKPLRQINQPISSWPSGTARYLYGVYFFRFIRDKYGEDKIQQLVEENSRHILPYMVNTTTSRVLGKDLDVLWKEFEKYLQELFDDKLKQIRSEGLQSGAQISWSNSQTTHPRTLSNGDVYYFRNDRKSEPAIMLLKKGSKKPVKFVEVHSERFDLHPDAGILVSQLDAVKNVNILSDLYHIDLRTAKKTQLTKGKRYRYAVWSPDGEQIIAVRNRLANSSLVLLNKKGERIKTLWQGSSSEVISEPDLSADGKHLVAAVWRKHPASSEDSTHNSKGNWNLELFDIASGTWETLLDSENIEMHPRFSNSGNSIVFVADYDDIYNVHEFNLETKQVSTLTNLLTGAQHPTYNNDGSQLLYTGYGPEGYNIFRMNMASNKRILLPSNMTPTNTKPAPTNNTHNDEIIVDSSSIITPYSPLKSVKPTWWFPHLLYEDDRREIGVFTGGSDALRRHNYFAMVGSDIENNWAIADINYIYDRWDPTFKLRATHLPNTFLEPDGSLQRIRFTDTLTAEFIFPFIKRDYQWGFHTAGIFERSHDERLATGVTPSPAFKNVLAGIATTYNSSKRYPLSISQNNGRRIKLVFENYDVVDNFFSGNVFSANLQEYIPLSKQQLIAIDFSIGMGNESPRQFRLGGNNSEEFSNPLFQATTVLFNRRQYSLRGYSEGLPGLRGRKMLVANAEWRFPIKKIERGFMVPLPLGIHQVSGAAFIDIGEAWTNHDDREHLRTAAGVEINTEVVFGYSITFNVRVGFAHGFKDDGSNQSYITIGSSF